MKKVLVLGATGSIGKNTLDVIDRKKDEFCVAGLVANSNEQIYRLAKKYDCPFVLQKKDGMQAVQDLVKTCNADIAVNGIAGSSGLLPSVYVLEAGIDLALANKETVVMAWNLVKDIAKKNDCKIIPVDSEHSAVFSLLNRFSKENVENIIITASGGSFLNYTKEQLSKITPQDAKKHPTWKMGAKITIDSSTLANKGLEVIEAARLFDFSPAHIKVVVHPQSRVHAFIQTKEGSLYSQISFPDMRRPIYMALTFPDLKYSPAGLDDFGGLLQDLTFDDHTFKDCKKDDTQDSHLCLDFYRPCEKKFSMLPLSYEALSLGYHGTIAYNAANEVAVEAFVAGKINFLDIAEVTKRVLSHVKSNYSCCNDFSSIQEISKYDEEMRQVATKYIKQ